MSSAVIPLGHLSLGARGMVVGYAEGAAVRRFAEMGLVPGATVTALRAAPLGDPIEYAVMESRVAIRRDDANLVTVEVCP